MFIGEFVAQLVGQRVRILAPIRLTQFHTMPNDHGVVRFSPEGAVPKNLRLLMKTEQAALLFSKLARRRVDLEQIHADINAGAPTDENGRLNVLTYAAWLLKEMNRGD